MDSNLPKFEGKMLDGTRCECTICGKKKKLGGLMNPIPEMQDRIPKIICLDCMMEQVALRDGISKAEALRRRKKKFESFYAFQETMFERYLKANNKKGFDSIEEANVVLDFVRGCWNKVPKDLHEQYETLGKQELKNIFKSLPFDFKAFSTLVKSKTGAKIGRNEPCPCGSGEKFKKCCGNNL